MIKGFSEYDENAEHTYKVVSQEGNLSSMYIMEREKETLGRKKNQGTIKQFLVQEHTCSDYLQVCKQHCYKQRYTDFCTLAHLFFVMQVRQKQRSPSVMWISSLFSRCRVNTLLTHSMDSLYPIGQDPDTMVAQWSLSRKFTVREHVKLAPSLFFKVQFPMEIVPQITSSISGTLLDFRHFVMQVEKIIPFSNSSKSNFSSRYLMADLQITL